MSDRAYTRFSFPLSVLADAALTDVVRRVFGLSTDAFYDVILTDPRPDEASGVEGITTRMVDGRPCVVCEDPDCAYGGSHIESELIRAGVPFLQVNAGGDEYGPTSTVFDCTTTEVIRVDHALAPVVGIGIIDGRVVVDPGEVRDFERYIAVRRAVLHWPAATAPALKSPCSAL